MKKEKNERMLTDYRTAAKWCNNSLILLNGIGEIDPDFYDYNAALFSEDEEGNQPEYFQYFLTDMSDGDAEYLKNTFDLIIGYSPRLEKYVLFVDHYGTAWDYVPCEVKSASWWETNGEKYGYKHN